MKKSSENSTSPEASKPSPKARAASLPPYRDLTPSEIDSLRQDLKENAEKGIAYFSKQFPKTPAV